MVFMDEGSSEKNYSLEPAKLAAREKGKQRIEKLVNLAYTIAGADVLVAKTAEVGGQWAKDRATEIKDRAIEKGMEIKNKIVERVTDARDRLVDRYERTKTRTIAKGTELAKRAAVIGLSPIAKAEEWISKIYELPAELKAWQVGREEEKVSAASLRAAVERRTYQEQLRLLQEQHRERLRAVAAARQAAEKAAREHRVKAKSIREKAAGMNKVRSAVANLKATL